LSHQSVAKIIASLKKIIEIYGQCYRKYFDEMAIIDFYFPCYSLAADLEFYFVTSIDRLQ
jgi:hypothetical protein